MQIGSFLRGNGARGAGKDNRHSKLNRNMKNQKMKRKDYEKELLRLQAQLCLLQDWVKDKGLRVVIVFEGRDGAGKGGTIKAITGRVGPRVFRLVALPLHPTVRRAKCTCSATCRTFPPRARSLSSIGVGITVPASDM